MKNNLRIYVADSRGERVLDFELRIRFRDDTEQVIYSRDVEQSRIADGDVEITVMAEGFLPINRHVSRQNQLLQESFVLPRKGERTYGKGRGMIVVPEGARRWVVAYRRTVEGEEETAKNRENANERVLGKQRLGIRKEQLETRDHKLLLSERLFKDEGTAHELLRAFRDDPEVDHVGESWTDSDVYFAEEIIVEVQPGTDEDVARQVLKSAGVEMLRSLPNGRTWLVKSKDSFGLGLYATCERLEALSEVANAYPNTHFKPIMLTLPPSDSTYFMHWHHTVSNLNAAWQLMRTNDGVATGDPNDKTFGDPNLVLGVIDTDFRSNAHPYGGISMIENPDLMGTVGNGLSKIARMHHTLVGIDDFDFGSTLDSSHGMSVVGVAAAKANNSPVVAGKAEGVVGAAPNVRLVLTSLPTSAFGYLNQLSWIVGNPTPPVVNLASPPELVTNSYLLSILLPLADQASILKSLHQNAVYGRGGRGQLYLFASGNGLYAGVGAIPSTTLGPNNTPIAQTSFLASSPDVITVGAYTLDVDGATKRFTNYSSFGPEIDIVGPSNGPDFGSMYDPNNNWAIPATQNMGSVGLPIGDMPGGAAVCVTELAEATVAGDSSILVKNAAGITAYHFVMIADPTSADFKFMKVFNRKGPNEVQLLSNVGSIIAAGTPVTAVPGLFGTAGIANLTVAAVSGDLTITLNTVAGFEAGHQILMGAQGGANHEVKTIAVGGVDVPNKKITFTTALAHGYAIGPPADVRVMGLTLERTLTVATVVGNQNLKVGNTALMYDGSPNQAVRLTPPTSAPTEKAEFLRVVDIVDHETIKVEATKHPHSVGTVVAFGPANYSSSFGGTSSACPFVAGIAALVLSAKPTLTWMEVREMLISTAIKFDLANKGWQGAAIHATHRPQGKGIWQDAAGNLLFNPVTQAPEAAAGAAVFSEWYGYGAVDALGAVTAAWAYSHDHRDLMIRDHLGDNGTADTNVAVNPVQSPDIWIRQASDPLTPLPAFDKHGPHQNPKKAQDNFIFARIKNRGTVHKSLKAWVRFYIALHDGTNAPGINTPFKFPTDWSETNVASQIPTNAGANTVYYLGEVELNKDDILPTSAGHFNDTDTSAKLVKIQWNAADQPPAGTALKLFLLVQVSPHDGDRNGLGAETNSNLSYREFAVGKWAFLKLSGAPLESLVSVDEFGTNVAMAFKVELELEIGNFETENAYIEIKRQDGIGTVLSEGSIYHDGAAWVAKDPAGNACPWITFSPPVITGGMTPATGTQTMVTFTGSFEASKIYQQVNLVGNLKSSLHSEKTPISFEEHYVVVSVSGAQPEAFAPTPPKLYPRSFAFADMAGLTQAVGEGFGPVSSNVFRVTSSFTAAANTNAYAIVDGTVFVQEGANAGLVNLVIKPLTQGINGFTPVKYFVYRGLVRTDFIDGTDPTLVTPLVPGSNSEWIAWLYGIHQNLNGAVPFESKAIGFDPANQLSTSLLEKYFFQPDPDFQLPPALKGVQLGTFSTAAGAAGIDVVLEEGHFGPDLAYVRAGHHEIDVSGAGSAFAARAVREQVLGFLDAAAYYGLHVREHGYVEHIVSGNVVKVQPADIHAEILAPFLSKNTLYIDLRDETGASYNFSGHHPPMGGGDNVEIGLVTGSLTPQKYQTSDWPLLIRSNTGSPVSTPEDYNAVYLRMLTDHLTKPILHIEHGDIENVDLLQRECFVEGDGLFVTGNTYTEELGFTHPNVPMPGGGPDDKLNVAWVIKLHLGMQEDGPVAWNTIPGALPTENLYDNRFGPLDVGDIWATGVAKVRWVANQARKYIDGSLRNFGYVSDRGVVYEGDVDANANPGRVLFFANAVNTFKTEEEMARSKGMSGGFSKMPSFFQELPDMKKLNLLFGVIDDGGTDVKSLQLIPTDSTSPQSESMMFVGLDKNEYLSLKALAPGFSADYPVSLKLEQVFSNMDYRKFKVGLQGLDASGVAGSAFPTSDVHVYTTNDVLCFSSAFSSAQPALDAYLRNAEEAAGAKPRTAIIASILRVPTTNEVVLPGDYVDRISPKDMVNITDSAIPTPNNNGGPWSIIQRTYDRATDSTTVKLSGATLTVHLATDGQLKIAERSLEDHFIDFDNQGTLSGLPEMSQIVANFDAALLPIVDGSTAKAALLGAIGDAPAKALQRARLTAANSNNANADDRVLYWARIKMAVALKSNAAMNAKLGTRDYEEILEKFEAVTRGYEGIDFSSVPLGIKKVIITGFDLFQINPTGPFEDNPSAAMALALHGKTLKDSGGVDRVFVQSAIFPVRYADFDGKDGKGVVEKMFKRFFDTGDPNYVAGNVPNMVISLSQTPFAGEIKLERFVCRNRGLGNDNLNLSGKQIPDEFGGSEFFEADLDPTKFKRSSNTGFPAGDLGTRITVQKAEFNHYFNNVFIYKLGTAESRFTCEGDAFGASKNDFYQKLPDGVAKVETTTDARLTGLVPTAANILAQPGLKSVRGSGGNFFSNEIGYRIAYLREQSNITPLTDRPKTGHYHVARLVTPSRPEPRNFPNPMHLDLETLKNLIHRMGDIIVDGNLP